MPKKEQPIKKKRNILFKQLSHSIGNPAVKSVIKTVLNRFINSTESKESLAEFSYPDLLPSQKQSLHQAIKNGIIGISFTASGQREAKKMEEMFLQKPADAVEELNDAYQFMLKMAEAKIPLTLEILQEMHRLALPHLPKATGGIRTYDIGKLNADYVPHDHLKPLLLNLLNFINNPPPGLGWTTAEAIVQGLFLSCHPFRDGNGRLNNILVVYMSILHGKIPPIASERANQEIFTQLNAAGIQNPKKIFMSEDFGPSTLTPLCIKHLLQLMGVQPGNSISWNLPSTGEKVTYEGWQALEAKKILRITEKNRQTALEVVTHTFQDSSLATPKIESSPPVETQLIEDFLTKSPSIFVREEGSAIIAKLSSRGARIQSGTISKLIAINMNSLFSELLQNFFATKSVSDLEKLQAKIHHLNFLQKIIIENQILLTPLDRINLSAFYEQLQGLLIQFAPFKGATYPFETLWPLLMNLVQMNVAIGSADICYPGDFISLHEFKTGQCASIMDRGILPDPIEISQTNGGITAKPMPLLLIGITLIQVFKLGYSCIKKLGHPPEITQKQSCVEQSTAKLIRQIERKLAYLEKKLAELKPKQRRELECKRLEFSLTEQREIFSTAILEKSSTLQTFEEIEENFSVLKKEFDEYFKSLSGNQAMKFWLTCQPLTGIFISADTVAKNNKPENNHLTIKF